MRCLAIDNVRLDFRPAQPCQSSNWLGIIGMPLTHKDMVILGELGYLPFTSSKAISTTFPCCGHCYMMLIVFTTSLHVFQSLNPFYIHATTIVLMSAVQSV